MAAQTTTFAVDNTAYVNVTVQGQFMRRVTVQEDYNSTSPPTTDLLQKVPATGTAIKIAKGTPAIFTPQHSDGYFQPGEIAGAIKTATGSITVQQIESSTI